MPDMLEGYVAGRRDLAEELLVQSGRDTISLHYAADLLWSSAWCGDDGIPQDIFSSRWKTRREVIGSTANEEKKVERAGDWLRFQTTTNWGIDLSQWACAEDYFKALSKKMRKKLGWLRNSYPKLNVHYDAIDTPAAYDRFLALFRERWPESDWEKAYYDRFLDTMRCLMARGQWFSQIMVDQEGQDVAAFTGYYTANAYNLHLLCRAGERLEKYSPGFFLVWRIMEHLYSEQRVQYCFLGPGRFDYKIRFLARELPIYRYEKRTWMNLPGIIRLYHRARRQYLRRG